MTSLHHRISFSLYRGALAALRALPPRLSTRVARTGAAFYWNRGGKRVRFARVNLEIVFPDKSATERDDIGRESFSNLAQYAIDLVRSEGWPLARVLAAHEFVGQEHLDAALARGRGAIVLAPHMGNFELGIRAMTAAGYKITAVAREMKNPLMREWVWARRKEGGGEVIEHRRAAPGILRALRGGRIIPLFNDQYQRRSHGVWAPFFGLRASTAPGVAILSQRSGAPIVPMYTIQIGPDRHRIVIGEPIDPPPRDADSDATVLHATTRYNEILEAVIREHPAQWMWSHRRFRHSPDLPADPYA